VEVLFSFRETKLLSEREGSEKGSSFSASNKYNIICAQCTNNTTHRSQIKAAGKLRNSTFITAGSIRMILFGAFDTVTP
jgi:hypothetical protein